MKWAILIVSFLLVIGLIGGWFYWFQWRPSQVAKECDKTALMGNQSYSQNPDTLVFKIDIDKDTYDIAYTQCLREKGIK